MAQSIPPLAIAHYLYTEIFFYFQIKLTLQPLIKMYKNNPKLAQIHH